jgi:pimeloyl-ACP methyl ester carboxylesterase
MRMAGAPESDIAGARRSSLWPRLEGLAHTLVYDAACIGDGRPPAARLAKITQPTLVASGGNDYFQRAADAVAAGVPAAERRTVEGQGHVVDPNVIVPVLERFYGQ